MTYRLIVPSDTIPDSRTISEAIVDGVADLVREHLRRKNSETQPNQNGLPKSNYYSEAADNVTPYVRGSTVCVDVDHPGLAMHYEGGTVYPKKKALAIPIDPSVAGIWPSEAGGIATGDAYSLVWPKNSDHGFIKDNESGDLLWLLVPKATIPADPTVLPTDGEILQTAEDYIMELFS